MAINENLKDKYHLTTEKLAHPKLTKRITAMALATLIGVFTTYAKPEFPNLASVRNPETTSFRLAENDNKTTISTILGISGDNIYSSGAILSSGPFLSGLYDSVLTALDLPSSPLEALKNLNITLGLSFQEPNQTLTSIVGIGDSFANDTNAFSLGGYVTNTLPTMETILSAQVDAEKDIENITLFGAFTFNATSIPQEEWNTQLELGIKYSFDNGSKVEGSGTLTKLELSELKASYSIKKVTVSLSYQPKQTYKLSFSANL